MKRYLVVIEETSTGYSAYSPDLEVAFPSAGRVRKSKGICKKRSSFTWKGCASKVFTCPNPTPTPLTWKSRHKQVAHTCFVSLRLLGMHQSKTC